MSIYPFDNTTTIKKIKNITYIYSPKSIYSGCIIKVNKGLYNNSQSGLAHLLEHIIFEQTPENKIFFDTVKRYNGNYNGSTSSYMTSYIFKIKNKTANEFIYTLKLFLRLITEISALKYPDKIKGVINIVNNEIEMLHENPELKLLEFKYMNDPEYISSIIPTNDFDNTTIDKLHEFINQYYCNFEILIFHNISNDFQFDISEFPLLTKIISNYPIDKSPILKKQIIKKTSYFIGNFTEFIFQIPKQLQLNNIIEYFIFIITKYFDKYAKYFTSINYSNEKVITLTVRFETNDYKNIINLYNQIFSKIFIFDNQFYQYYLLKNKINAQYTHSLLSDLSNINDDIEHILYCFKYNNPYIYEVPKENPEIKWNELMNMIQLNNCQITVNFEKQINYQLNYKNMRYDIERFDVNLNNPNAIQPIKSIINLADNHKIQKIQSPNLPDFDISYKHNINEYAFEINFNNICFDYTRYLAFNEKIKKYFDNKYYGIITNIYYNFNILRISIKDFENEQINNLKMIFYYLFDYSYSKDFLLKHHNKIVENVKMLINNIIEGFDFIINTEYYKYTIFDVLSEEITRDFKFKNKLDINKIKYSKHTPMNIKMILENIKKYPLHNNNILYKKHLIPFNRVFYTFDSNCILIKQIAQKLLYSENDIYHRIYRHIIVKYLNKLFFEIFRTQKQYTYTAAILNRIFNDKSTVYYLINFLIIIDKNKFDIETIASEINSFIYDISPKLLMRISQEQINTYFNDFKINYLDDTEYNQLKHTEKDINNLKKIEYINKIDVITYYLKYISNNKSINVNTFIMKEIDLTHKMTK